MANHSTYAARRSGQERIDPFSVERLQRVDLPTTRIVGEIPRRHERDHGFNRAARGDLGPVARRERYRASKKHPLSAALVEMTAHLVPVDDGPVAPVRAPIPTDPEILTRHIKELAYFLRADLVGICRIPPYAVYSHDQHGSPVEFNHEYAIVILIDQDYRTSRGSNGRDWISASQSYHSYSMSAFIACSIANYIRRLGYPARAHHQGNYQVVVPPLLLWAGLGEMSRMGIVVNPFLGARFKAAVVTTDLPLVPDRPIDFGLQDFCRECMKCARECPAKAISTGEKETYNGYETWKTNFDACTVFRVANQNGSSCGRCAKVCPWNKPDKWYHTVGVWAAQRSRLARRVLIWIDDLLGFGRPVERYRWWFDLEEVDGVLRIPGNSKRRQAKSPGVVDTNNTAVP